MNTTTLLENAKKLIENPDNWCKFQLATDKQGETIAPNHKKACKWCALGAIIKFQSDEDENPEINEARKFLAQATITMNWSNIVNINDFTDHQTVMKMYDLAIELSKKE